MKVERERCSNCHHGSHPSGPCTTVTVSGPPATSRPTPKDLHPGRTVTPCECKEHQPYVNGTEVV